MIRRPGTLACALGLLLGAAGVTRAAEGVVVAFRADAAPFAQAAGAGFAGFLVDLCEEGVGRAGYSITERRPVTAVDRFSGTASGQPDLICDPTTITRERARHFDFSPIVFIANASFLARDKVHFLTDAEIERSDDCQRARAASPGRELVAAGMVGETTANASFDLARAQNRLPDTLEYAICKVSFPTYAEGVAETCGGFVSFYFGDVDILRAQVAGQKGCVASIDRNFMTYEPYALAIPSADPEFRRALVAALFEMFADGTATRFYEAAFGDSPMSEPLRMLFRINSIPRGQPIGN